MPLLAKPTTAELEPELRAQLRLVTLAWVFGSIWNSTITGAALTRYQIELGTPDYAYGLFAAVPSLSYLAQIPATLFQARHGQRKGIFLATAIFGRLMWIVTAAIPWCVPDRYRDFCWMISLGSIMLAYAGDTAATPAWIDWMADIVPMRLRGRYFAQRVRIGQFVALATVMVIGAILYLTHEHLPRSYMIIVTTGLLAVAGVVGVIDILHFQYLPDPVHPAKGPAPKIIEVIGEPLRNRDFRWYLAFRFTLVFGTGYISQYIWLYVLKVLRFDDLLASTLLVAIPLLMYALFQKPWGRLADRFGKKPVLAISAFIIVNGSWGWIFIGHGSTPLNVLGYAIAITAMLAWPGVELASFNVLLGLTGTREGRRSGAAYVALNGLAVAAGGLCSGLFAAKFSAWLGGWRGVLPLVGVPITYHGLLFIISGALRAIAACFALKIHEPRATATRDVVQFISNSLYTNARDATLLPTRLATRAYQFTYRLRPRR